jgi:glycine cleavage system H protein
MPEHLEATHDKFTFRVATDRLYGEEGIWAFRTAPQGNAEIRLGLTDFLQQRSGDMAFVSLKPKGTRLATGDEFAQIETVKATVSLFSPVAGTVREVNQALDRNPELVNQDPYGKGWFAILEAPNWEADRTKLLEPQAYFKVMQLQIEKELKQS